MSFFFKSNIKLNNLCIISILGDDDNNRTLISKMLQCGADTGVAGQASMELVSSWLPGNPVGNLEELLVCSHLE